MNAIVIDDTQTAIDNLVQKMRKYPDINIVATAGSGVAGLDLVMEHRPELLFLDIELPDMTGLEILESMRDIPDYYCYVVIYTAYDDYMLPAFRNRAFDFLLKPIDDNELDTIMERFYSDRPDTQDMELHDDTLRPHNGKLLFYTNAVDFRLVQISDICMFTYDHEARAWTVVAAGCDKPLRLKRNIKKESLLAIDSRFIQVSQRHIINMNYLLEVCDNRCCFYPPFDNIDDVKVGRLYRRKLVSSFNSF